MHEIRKALANLIDQLSKLIIPAAVIGFIVWIVFGIVAHAATCKAWRQQLVTCESPGCKDTIYRERPTMCQPPSM